MTNSVGIRCREAALLALLSLPVYAKNTPKIPPIIAQASSLSLIRKIPHSGYSEGLDFADGYLWNALPKIINKIDPKDGTVVQRFPPATDYSESLKWVNGALFNLSFSNNGIYRGTLGAQGFTFQRIGGVPEQTGWGLESSSEGLIVTGHFSHNFYILDPTNGKVRRKLTAAVKDLEDLALDGSRVWTSSFSEFPGQIFTLDLKTGARGPLYKIPEPDQCPIIDGIAREGRTLWITGKECPSIYQVKIP